MLLSILRSPNTPTYLHEPEFYTMTGYDGMRDEGSHHFEYALTAYGHSFEASEIVADAEAYNAGLLAVAGRVVLPPPPITVKHAQLNALKWAEKGEALIARIVEARGQRSVAEIALTPRIKKVLKVNLLERRGQTLYLQDSKARMPLRPWEIATLRLELA
jgi:alpha-mannosidase